MVDRKTGRDGSLGNLSASSLPSRRTTIRSTSLRTSSGRRLLAATPEFSSHPNWPVSCPGETRGGCRDQSGRPGPRRCQTCVRGHDSTESRVYQENDLRQPGARSNRPIRTRRQASLPAVRQCNYSTGFPRSRQSSRRSVYSCSAGIVPATFRLASAQKSWRPASVSKNTSAVWFAVCQARYTAITVQFDAADGMHELGVVHCQLDLAVACMMRPIDACGSLFPPARWLPAFQSSLESRP